MSEIIYKYTLSFPRHAAPAADIRWLTPADYHIFAEHLAFCGQRIITEDVWREICDEGTVYCGLFVDDRMTARACREMISDDVWEIADVRTAQDYRNRGQAFAVCNFVLRYILDAGKTPSIRTEEHNIAMQKVITKLGFTLK